MTDEQGPADAGAKHQVMEINGLKFIRSGGQYLPASGSWPCQHAADPKAPEALVSFLYRVLRDGAPAPSDVENHAIQASTGGQAPVAFTNPHLEAYARSVAGLLLRPIVADMVVEAENRVDQLGDAAYTTTREVTYQERRQAILNERAIAAGRLKSIADIQGEMATILDRAYDSASSMERIAEDLDDLRKLSTVLESLVTGNPGCNEDNLEDEWVRRVRGTKPAEHRPYRIVVIHRDGCAEGVHSVTLARADADFVIEVTMDGNLRLTKDRYADTELVEYR